MGAPTPIKALPPPLQLFFVGSLDDLDMSAPPIVGLARGQKSGVGLVGLVGSQTLPSPFLRF